MNRPLARTASLLASCCALGTGAASAAVTVYTDRAAFEAAIGPHVNYTFDADQGFPAAPGRTGSFGPVSALSAGTGTPAYVRSWPEGSGNQTLSGQYNDVLTDALLVPFHEPHYAVGFDMYADGDGLVNVQFLSPTGPYATDFAVGPFTVNFFGLIATDPIHELLIRNAGDSRSQRYKGIDNFTVVPEPAALAPLSSLSALLMTRRRVRASRGVSNDRKGVRNLFWSPSPWPACSAPSP